MPLSVNFTQLTAQQQREQELRLQQAELEMEEQKRLSALQGSQRKLRAMGNFLGAVRQGGTLPKLLLQYDPVLRDELKLRDYGIVDATPGADISDIPSRARGLAQKVDPATPRRYFLKTADGAFSLDPEDVGSTGPTKTAPQGITGPEIDPSGIVGSQSIRSKRPTLFTDKDIDALQGGSKKFLKFHQGLGIRHDADGNILSVTDLFEGVPQAKTRGESRSLSTLIANTMKDKWTSIYDLHADKLSAEGQSIAEGLIHDGILKAAKLIEAGQNAGDAADVVLQSMEKTLQRYIVRYPHEAGAISGFWEDLQESIKGIADSIVSSLGFGDDTAASEDEDAKIERLIRRK